MNYSNNQRRDGFKKTFSNNRRPRSEDSRSSGFSRSNDRSSDNRSTSSNSGFRNNNFQNRKPGYGSSNNSFGQVRDNRFSNSNRSENNRNRNFDNRSSNDFNQNQERSSFRSNNSSDRPRSEGFRGQRDNRFGQNQRRSSNFRSGGFGQRRSFDSRREDFEIPLKDESLRDPITKTILDILLHDDRPIPMFVLIPKTIDEFKKRYNINVYLERGEIVHVINSLKNQKLIATNNSDKFYLDYMNYPTIEGSEAVGKINIISSKFAFINPEGATEKSENVFVHSKNFNGAIDGDKVRFQLLDTTSNPKSKETQLDGTVLEVLEHSKDFFVGEVIKKPELPSDSAFFCVLDNKKILSEVQIKDPFNLVEGLKVVVKITDFSKDVLVGEVTKILGHKNDVGVDIESIVLDHGVEIDFPASVKKTMENFDKSFAKFENQTVRKDLTDINFVTIDPASSKDFDDAIYVEKHEDHFKVLVAIADVASYIELNSELDEVAKSRGTSVYLVNSVIPMLPFLISNDLCSLNPNEKRCAIVNEFKVSFDGDVLFDSAQIYPAFIKSKKRFSYDEVNAYFKKETSLDDVDPTIIKMLDEAYELFFLMEKAKYRRGYINFDIPEAKIIVDEKNFPTEIKIYERWHAQILIENLMIAANEAVTYIADNHKIPFIYRVHGKPKKEALERFSLQTKPLDFKITNDFNDLKPSSIAMWLTANANNPYLDIIGMMLLRCMDKAVYSDENIGHFGLASKHYTHFTSPIRRYPDLLVHRLFWMYLFTKDQYTDAQKEMVKNELHSLCEQASALEMRSVTVERSVNQYKFVQYMQKFVGQEFEGVITSVNPKGFYMRLDNTIEGYAPCRLTKLDFFEFDESREVLVGKDTNKVLSLGTVVKARLVLADLETAKIDFELTEIIKSPI